MTDARRSAVHFLVCALTAFGCSDSGSSDFGVYQAGIVNGERSEEFDNAVVRLNIPQEEALCSGSLVAPNIVLTALHCVADFNTFGMFSCESDGTLTTTNPGDGQIGQPVEPSGVLVHTGLFPDQTIDAVGARIFTTRAFSICQDDLALVVLDRDLPGPYLPIRLDRKTVAGEFVRVVGYGQTAEPVSSGRYHRTGRRVQSVNPESKATPPRTLAVNEGACQGDSGGPAISEKTGAVVGVYSLSAGASCVTPLIKNIYTQIAPFKSLIQEAFEFAGADPIVETDPATGGTGGLTGAGGGPGQGGDTANSQGGSESGGTGNEQGGSVARGGGVNQSGGSELGEGSGSRRDSSCACRVAGMRAGGTVSGALAFAVAASIFARRRRRPLPI